jgi:hypothetical protein
MSDDFCTDAQAEALLAPALKTMADYYQARGVFQGRFGFGERPAVVVVDFAYGWTDEAYSGGTARMDAPVEHTRTLLDAARAKGVPIYFTTLNYRPEAAAAQVGVCSVVVRLCSRLSVMLSAYEYTG